MCSTVVIVVMIGLVNKVSSTADTYEDLAKLQVSKVQVDRCCRLL